MEYKKNPGSAGRFESKTQESRPLALSRTILPGGRECQGEMGAGLSSFSLSSPDCCLVAKPALGKYPKLLHGSITEAMCFHARLPKDYEKQALILFNSKI